MGNSTWVYTNHTEGGTLSTNDLSFLVHSVRNVKGINLTEEDCSVVLLTGNLDCVRKDWDGQDNHISIKSQD